MPRIFISYRRAGSQAITGRIRDRLALYFGVDSIFMDVEKIPYGVDFRTHVKSEIIKHDVLLAVIGPQWTGSDGRDHARIMEETDPVRVEIEAAMLGNVTVIPVLVDDTRMPSAGDLPECLDSFRYLHAATVNSGQDFHVHMDRLIRFLDGIAPPEPAHLPVAARKGLRSWRALAAVAAAGAALIVGAVVAATWRGGAQPGTGNPAAFMLPPGSAVSVETSALKRRVFDRMWAYLIEGLEKPSQLSVIPSDEELNQQPDSRFRQLFIGPQAASWYLVANNLKRFAESDPRTIEYLVQPNVIPQDNRLTLVVHFGTFDPRTREYRRFADSDIKLVGLATHADTLAAIASYQLVREIMRRRSAPAGIEQEVARQFASELAAIGFEGSDSCPDFACLDAMTQGAMKTIAEAVSESAMRLARNTAAEAYAIGDNRAEQ